MSIKSMLRWKRRKVLLNHPEVRKQFKGNERHGRHALQRINLRVVSKKLLKK